MAQINRAVEFHDSSLVAIELQHGNVTLRFDPAYVHESEGEPGRSDGKGYLQKIDLVLDDVKIESMPSNRPAILSYGIMKIDDEKIENLISLPVSAEGEIVIFLETSNGEVFKAKCRKIRSFYSGTATYIDEFRA